MFKRKDVIRTLFLFVVILVVMVTLSQILVVHRRNHTSNKFRDSEKARGMLTMLLNIERSIEAMMKKEYLPGNKYLMQLTADIYAERIKQQLLNLSKTNRDKIGAQLKRGRRFGDGTYSSFHERKLRFLEMNENEWMTQLKFEHKVNEVETTYNVNTTDVEKNLNRSSSKNNHNTNYYLEAQTISSGNENGVHNVSEKLYVARQINSSRNKQDINGDTFSQRQPQATIIRYSTSKYCPEIPITLVGRTIITPRVPDHHADEIEFADINQGGYWKPLDCTARQKTAIIIPYRNRETHLHTLLHYIIPVLKKQLIEFRIFVPEQDGEATFNKGRLMNAGFMEAWKLWAFDCVIFHDVDLLPENDRNMYTCGKFPRHMSISVDKFSYRLPYWTLVGGVFSIKREHYLKVNGYSNLYWGWGAEDDDMAYRLKASDLKIERPPATVGKYKMIKHANRETSPVKMRAYLLKTVKKRYHRDGLNTLDYRVIFTNNTKLYTHIMVDIGQPPDEAANITKLLN